MAHKRTNLALFHKQTKNGRKTTNYKARSMAAWTDTGIDDKGTKELSWIDRHVDI